MSNARYILFLDCHEPHNDKVVEVIVAEYERLKQHRRGHTVDTTALDNETSELLWGDIAQRDMVLSCGSEGLHNANCLHVHVV